MTRILVLDGHPDASANKPNSHFSSTLAKAYIAGAIAAGHEVRKVTINDLAIDWLRLPTTQQPDEAPLLELREEIVWAQHLVWAYPTWWGGLPAQLKALVDRTFVPGFGYKYHQGKVWWDKLLPNRTARLLVTMDTPPWYYYLVYGAPGHYQMRYTILGFCGIWPVRISSFGVVKTSSTTKRAKWLAKAHQLGGQAR